MAKINIKFNNKNYSIDSSLLADATARLEAHLMSMMEEPEERLEGDGAEFYTLAPTALSFRSTAPLNELQDVQINGVTVDPSNYTLEEGSTIVTFPIDYLKTLNIGSYEVSVASDSKTVKGGFTVAAPELNEHGFYYNQPYAAYVNYFDTALAIFIRDNGTLDIIFMDGRSDTCAYTVDSSNMVVVSATLGELHCTISNDGAEIYNVELDTTFTTNNENFVADKDYFYLYKEDFGGYEVAANDRTKSSYDDIKTGINGHPTIALAKCAFMLDSVNSIGNTNMTVAPVMPNTIINIGGGAFGCCDNLMSITIPDSVTFIDTQAFGDCTSLTNIIFEGTKAQWNAVVKGENWKTNVPATHIHCADGDVAL